MKRTLVISWGVMGVALGGMAVAFPYAAGYYARVSVENIFKRARNDGARVAAYNSIETNIWDGEVVLNGVVLESGGADGSRLTIDTFRTHFPWELNGTISAGLVQITNFSLSSGALTYTIPEISVEDFVFRSKEKTIDPSPVKTFLKRIDASEITAPEWKTLQQDDGERTVTGLEISGLDHGKAESMRFTALHATGKSEYGNTIDVRAGEGVYSTLDIAALAAIYTDTSTEKAPLEELVGQAEIKDFTIKGFSEHADDSVTIESLTLDKLYGRTLAVPFSALAALNARLAKTSETTAEDLELYSTLASELTSGFTIGSFRFKGFKVHNAADNTQMAIDTVAFEKFENAALGAFSLSDIRIQGKSTGHLTVDRFALHDLDFKPSVAYFKSQAALAGENDAPGEPSHPFASAPTFSSIVLEKFALENTDFPLAFDAFSITASNHVKGIPLQASAEMKGIRGTDAAQKADMFGARAILKEIGLDAPTVDYSFGYRWDEKTQNLFTENVAFNLHNAGNLRIAGGVGPIHKSIFSSPQVDEEFVKAVLDSTVQPVRIDYQDFGLANKLFSYFSQQWSVPETELRAGLKQQLVDLNSSFESFLDGKSLRAIQNFIDKPERLSVALEPSNPVSPADLYVAYQLEPQSIPLMFNISVRND